MGPSMTNPEKHSWIQKRGLLLVLLLAYVFTTSLVIEQERTIETQRALIRDLFRDSMELSQIKMKQAIAKRESR